jgi:hypothetical protein
MPLKDIIYVYSENHTKHIYTFYGQNAESLNINGVVYRVTIVL